MERDRDPGLDRLAAELRQRGVPPRRDLWPDIDAAIRQREQAGVRRSRTAWWRAAAAAAAVLIVVVGARDLLDRVPVADVGGAGDAPVEIVVDGAPAPEGGMAAIERALAELGEALKADPDNHNLSRLVLMVHRTRGELLRREPVSGPRTS
jgi:hypothetical protein